MRQFMRTLGPHFLGLALLISSAACHFSDRPNGLSSLTDQPAPTPRIMEYASDLGMAWNPGFERGMWRTEIDDTRQAGPVHIVSEAQCPDRFRVLVTGAEQSETIYVGTTQYHRIDHQKWQTQPLPMKHMILNSCGKSSRPPYDPVRIRMLADQFTDVEVQGPVLREMHGAECREWTRTIPQFGKPLLVTTCYDTQTGAVVQSKVGNLITTNSWNVNISIKAPI